ncbi:MAG: RHS repeat-associated protein [Flavobacteriaceae bacterium]|jgi:RHS repeat-associated protein
MKSYLPKPQMPTGWLIWFSFAVGWNLRDLYPFGMQMPDRQTQVESYRYAYNGMELDNEISGAGNSYTTEFRQYDPRLGRWKSLDPLMASFPHMSPYVGFDNNPIFFIDPYGLSSSNDGVVQPEGTPDSPVDTDLYTDKDGQEWMYSAKSEKWHTVLAGGGIEKKAKRTGPTPYEGSDLATNVYKENQEPGVSDKNISGGWKISDKKSDISDVTWKDTRTGFKSNLYERTGQNGIVEYAYVIAGTDDSMDAKEDLAQFLRGISAQTPQVLENVRQILRQIDKGDLTMVGHSLGGSLANVSALKYGLRSIAYNPAWPHDDLLNKHGISRTNDRGINNIVLVGDIVNSTQENAAFMGKRIAPVGKTHIISSGSLIIDLTAPIDSHRIEIMRGALRND